MRLYLKDGEASEITKVKFLDVRNKMETGGSVSLSKYDPQMASIGTIKKIVNQRVEVRMNDGSTVLWEGIITDVNYNSRSREWAISGLEGLRALDEVGCFYNANKGSGVVTAIDDDDTPPKITDTNQTFDAGLAGCEALFSNQSDVSKEIQYPNAATAWVSDFPTGGGNAPDNTSGAFGTLALGGEDQFMYLDDANERGLDYYALVVELQFTNHAAAQKLLIWFQGSFSYRTNYAENGADSPGIFLYDDDEATWQEADANGVTGLGRFTDGYAEFGGTANANMQRPIVIDNTDIGGFFDADGKIKIAIVCGGPITPKDIIKANFIRGDLTYSTLFTAEANAYTIDIVDGSNLTFTGQTPYADNVRVGDTFRVGQDVDTILAYLWRDGMINWLTYETDGATGIIDCMDLRSSMVGPTLRRYAETKNWELWQEVGWNIRFGNTYDATGLSLTHVDFLPGFGFGIQGREIIRRLGIFGADYWTDILTGFIDGVQSFWDKLIRNNTISSQAEAVQAISNFSSRHESIAYNFHGVLNMDAGVDYSAIGLGEKITITLWTDKVVMTDAVIDEIAWKQEAAGDLYAELTIII